MSQQSSTSHRMDPLQDLLICDAFGKSVSSHTMYTATIKVDGKVVSKNKGAATVNTKGVDEMVPLKAYLDQPASSIDNTHSSCAADRSPANANSLYLWYDIHSPGGAGCRDAFSTIGAGKIEATVHAFQAMSTDKTTTTEIGTTTYKNCSIFAHRIIGGIGAAILLYDGYDGSLTMYGSQGNKLGKAAFGDKGSNKK